MRIIELTQGQVTVIDDSHYEWVSQYRWLAHKQRDGSFYAERSSESYLGKQKSILLHRKIMEHILGRPLTEDEQVDHKNLDKLCNIDNNLRLASHGQNKMNGEVYKNSTSGLKGVSWHSRRGKWQCRIQTNSDRASLGYFTDPIEAAKAYDKAAKELHGEFARLNFPEDLA